MSSMSGARLQVYMPAVSYRLVSQYDSSRRRRLTRDAVAHWFAIGSIKVGEERISTTGSIYNYFPDSSCDTHEEGKTTTPTTEITHHPSQSNDSASEFFSLSPIHSNHLFLQKLPMLQNSHSAIR